MDQPTLRVQTCKGCGDEFAYRKAGPGRLRRWCDGCRYVVPPRSHRLPKQRIWWRSDVPCGTCGKGFYPNRKDQPFCSSGCNDWWKNNQEHPFGKRRECGQCGTTYRYRTERDRYCSKACGMQAAREIRKATGAKAEAKKRYEAKRKAGLLSPNATCEQCSKPFRKQTATQLGRFCSPDCHHAWLRLLHGTLTRKQQTHAKAQRKMDKAQEGTIGQHQWIAGACQSCGDTYIVRPTGGKYPEAYCSKRCRGREIRHRRHARMRTPIPTPTPTRVIRAKVYERDQWTCQLCYEPVRMDMVHTLGTSDPHPLAPTLDHIIPLARGGWHGPDNVQTAHFMCNCLKSDRHEVA